MPGLTVVQDESPLFQHSAKMSIEELCQRFAVRFILKGQVHKLGARIRVNAELVESLGGRVVWADKLDRELRDLGDFFAIQDEITEEIVTALDIKLLSGEIARITRKVLKNPEAQECLYHGERACCGRRLTWWSYAKPSDFSKRSLGLSLRYPLAMRKRRWLIGPPLFSE